MQTPHDRNLLVACFRARVRAAIAAAVVMLIVVPPVAAQRSLSPHDVARLSTVTGAALSPDGTEVAFLRTVQRDPLAGQDGAAFVELHVVDLEGRERAFVAGDVNVSGVAWTPDGQGISFLARRGADERRSLYVIPRNGGEARKVLAHTSEIAEYVWSPDGQRVAFLATEARSREQQELDRKGFNQIVYEENVRPVRVWIADVPASDDTSNRRMLDLPGSASSVRWSPAADRLALTLAPTPLVDDSYMSKRLHVVDAESGAVIARIDNPGKIGDFAWSPDGTSLAVVAAADPNDPLEGRLMVVSASGGDLVDVLPNWDDGHVHAVGWRDADTVAFLAYEGVGSFLGTIGRTGDRLEKTEAYEDLVASALFVSPNGQVAAMIGDSPRHPPEVFLARPLHARPTRLTHSNAWLNDVTLARQEVVQYKARDGLDLQGLLIRPLNEQPGRRYPLILVVHGGPEAHYSNGWLTGYSTPGQMAAARGFAVFYPNYRGSTGRGVTFSKMSQGDPAGKEFDDLVDAVDHLISTGLVDREKVGVTGGSYGGYASAWAATRYSDRFAASVMFVGISNKISKIGTSDIPNELFMVHERKWPWEDWNHFLQRSPIYHVEKARTPILILHGSEDPRVHPGQSLELYRHLKLRTNTPVRLVFYPGEGHGNRRAASRLDYSLRLMQWMEHYLQGPGGEPPPYELSYEEGRNETS
jgi:dipeptidyl aminopeptidase/acylaminoacyl peptidase